MTATAPIRLGKEPWYARLPVVRQLRQSVGVQRFMLVAGVVILGVYVLVAILAPLLAPYGFAQLRGGDGQPFPTHAAPSGAHPWGTTLAGYDVMSRVIWATQTELLTIVVAVIIGLLKFGAGWFLTRDDAETTSVGSCMHNEGTNSSPDLNEVDCSDSKAQYKVVQKFDGSSDDSKCEAVTEATISYVQYGGGHDVVLCLKEVK